MDGLIARQNRPRAPLEVDTTLPEGWDGTADETPATAALFQTALDGAAAAQVSGIYIIELDKDTTYDLAGGFNIDNASYGGTNWVVIRSSGYESSPPVAVGTRVVSGDEANQARIEITDGSLPFICDYGSHHIVFVGLEFFNNINTVKQFMLIGHSKTTAVDATQVSEISHHIGIDRCIFHAPTTTILHLHGLRISCDDFYLTNSRLAGIKHTSDGQGVQTVNSRGPWHIENNYVEASGENFLFGSGFDLVIEGVVISDVTFIRNHCNKPSIWNKWHADFNGIPDANGWEVKNSFEIKTGQRFNISGNVFSGTWSRGQNGTIFLLTLRAGAISISGQLPTDPNATIKDIRIENNLFKEMMRWMNFLVEEDFSTSPSIPMERVLIQNNLVYEQGGNDYGADGFSTGRHLNIQSGNRLRPANDIVFNHNTTVWSNGHPEGHLGMDFETDTIICKDFTLTNNILYDGQFDYSKLGSSGKMPDRTKTLIADNNGIIDPAFNNDWAGVGSGNVTAATLVAAKFTDEVNLDYTLQSDSPFKGIADNGIDAGVFFPDLNNAIAGVE